MDRSFYKVDSVTVRLHEVEVLFQAHWVGLWRSTQRQERGGQLLCELETGSVIDVILGMFLNFLVNMLSLSIWCQYIHVTIATLTVTAAIVIELTWHPSWQPSAQFEETLQIKKIYPPQYTHVQTQYSTTLTYQTQHRMNQSQPHENFSASLCKNISHAVTL